MAQEIRSHNRWTIAVMLATCTLALAAGSAAAQPVPVPATRSSRPGEVKAAIEEPTPALLVSHVRGIGFRDAQALVSDADRRSPTVHALLAALQQTDVIVMVEIGNRDGRTSGALFWGGAGHGVRWLRVIIDIVKPPVEQAGWLAHELQHAVEVAGAPDVQDAAGLSRLYERIGYPVGKGEFETDRACSTQKQALRDLGVRR